MNIEDYNEPTCDICGQRSIFLSSTNRVCHGCRYRIDEKYRKQYDIQREKDQVAMDKVHKDLNEKHKREQEEKDKKWTGFQI